jgi:D-inositol-3-phosphate glycosyltransferase
LRLLFVSAYYRPHVGGIERFVETLATALAARGHEVTVLCCNTDGAPERELIDGVDVVRVPAWNGLERRLGVPWPVPAPRALLRALRRDADVVHAQDVLYATSLAALFRSRAPVVVTQHVGFVPQRSRLLDTVERTATRLVGPAARRATRIAALTDDVAAWIADTWGVAAEVFPVGVAPAQAQASRAEFGLPEARFVALFVGRDVAKKRLDVLLAAADPEAYELAVVTDRPLGERPGVRGFAFMPPDRLAALMSVVDAFVLPSVGEGLPISLQEAMAAGLPVVTTPGYGFSADDDVLAIQPEPASIREALRRLDADDALRARLGDRSRAIAGERFGLESFVDAYDALYRTVHSPVDTARGPLPRS